MSAILIPRTALARIILPRNSHSISLSIFHSSSHHPLQFSFLQLVDSILLHFRITALHLALILIFFALLGLHSILANILLYISVVRAAFSFNAIRTGSWNQPVHVRRLEFCF